MSDATNDETQKENFNAIKKAIMGSKEKALVIQLNEEKKEVSAFENIN